MLLIVKYQLSNILINISSRGSSFRYTKLLTVHMSMPEWSLGSIYFSLYYWMNIFVVIFSHPTLKLRVRIQFYADISNSCRFICLVRVHLSRLHRAHWWLAQWLAHPALLRQVSKVILRACLQFLSYRDPILQHLRRHLQLPAALPRPSGIPADNLFVIVCCQLLTISKKCPW